MQGTEEKTVSVSVWLEEMPKRCCVGGCTSNYDTEEEYINVYRFPGDLE